jgi:hypothetical protein
MIVPTLLGLRSSARMNQSRAQFPHGFGWD